MLKRVEKLALALIAAGILCGSFSMSANAETKEVTIPADAIASGVVDEDYGQITWYIDKDRKLVVNGTGNVWNSSNNWEEGKIPWYPYREKIESVVMNVSGMSTAEGLFYGCTHLESVDFSNFDTNIVTNMRYMFLGCTGLEELDLTDLDTGSVENMSGMFAECSYLESIDLSNFDTSQVTDMNSMFDQCRGPNNLDLNNFDTSKVTDMERMFRGCAGLHSIDLSNFDTGNVFNMSSMFEECMGLESLDLSDFDTSHVTNMDMMFTDCRVLKTLDVSSFDTSNVRSMGGTDWWSGMFGNCKSLEYLDLSNFDTSQVTNMSNMFHGCENLEHIDLSSFDTSQVTDMSSMFSDCKNLRKLDLSSFDTKYVQDMRSMFNGCWSLSRLDLSGFDTKYLEFVDNMFEGCSSLATLDLSGFDTKRAYPAEYMLLGCSGLKKIIIPANFNIEDVELPSEDYEEDEYEDEDSRANYFGWIMPDGTEIFYLPIGLEESIIIKKGLTVSVTEFFSDVHQDWYTDYVKYVYHNELMIGIRGTDRFEPNRNITKAQVAQVLYNMENTPEVENWEVFMELKDVYESEWYANAVAWAYNNSIVTGDTNAKKFFPNADVTREQLAIMMYRYAKYKGMNTSASSNLAGLKNAENVSNWALDGVKWAVGAGLISGIEKNGVKDLAPQGNATRAQMAAILMRFCEQ